MMKKNLLKYAILVLEVLSLASCSTTRVLGEGEYRLQKNIIVVDDDSFKTSELSSYVKQQPSWSPMMYVYNWSFLGYDNAISRFFKKIGTAPVVFQPNLVDASVSSIERHLEYMGYYGSKVSATTEPKKKQMKVKYDVQLGKRYVIDSIRFRVPNRGDFAADFYADTANISVKVGDYLSQEALEAESERSAATMRTKGYYGFSKYYYTFLADTLTQGRNTLTMEVREYSRNESRSAAKPLKKSYLNDITIEYPKSIRFREDILRDLTTIKPGMQYNENDITTTYSRLSTLKNFSSVAIEMSQVDSNKVDCAIKLSSSPEQGFKVNLESSVNSTGLISISPQLNFYHKNIFGGGERLSLGFMGNFQFMPNSNTKANEFGVSAGLSFPRFLGLPYSHFSGINIPGTDIGVSYNYQDRPEYTRSLFSTSYAYSGRTHNGIIYKVYPIQMNIVKMLNIDFGFLMNMTKNPAIWYTFMDHFDAGVGGSFSWSSSNEAVPSTSYHYYRLSADLSGNAISLLNRWLPLDDMDEKTIFGVPYSQYVRGEFTAGRTFRFGYEDKQSIATRFLFGGGYAYGNSSTLPFEKQFYCGGANSMRGWQARSLGPGTYLMDDYFMIPSQTGDLKLEANLEYRFPIFWKIEGALFVDAGNIWSLYEENLNLKEIGRSIAMDWGPGVRVNLNFLVIRIDTGIKLRDPSREHMWIAPNEWLHKDGFTIHFGVGYPF